jgi:hypothetical protein
MNTRTLVVIALIVGAALGLAYAWLIEPVSFSETSPAQVMKSYREAWLIMSAEALAQDGDWERTQARLNALRDADLSQTIADLFERYQVNGPNPTARALARLADRLNARTPAMQVYLAEIIAPTPEIVPTAETVATPQPIASAVPTATPEPLPTVVPTATPVPDYQVLEREAICTHGSRPPQIQVIVKDQIGVSVPGKVVLITWEGGGQDRFVTGFKPEIDPGYGDFDMQPDLSYNVGVDKPTSVVVSGLRADPCESDGRTSWRLILAPRTP